MGRMESLIEMLVGTEGVDEFNDMAEHIADRLGESPEAWRGAHEMIQLIAAAGSSWCDSDGVDNAAQKSLVTLGVLAVLLRRHPCMKAMRRLYEQEEP